MKKEEKIFYELHAEICKAMAAPLRLEIIDIIQNDEMNVKKILEKTGGSKANISRHLAILKNKGILKARREGINVYYSLSNPKVLKACFMMRDILIEQMKENKRMLKYI